MSCFKEPVNNCENYRINLGWWEADEVQRDVGPSAVRDRSGLQEPRWCLSGVLILGADDTGGHKRLDFRFHGAPPEASTSTRNPQAQLKWW